MTTAAVYPDQIIIEFDGGTPGMPYWTNISAFVVGDIVGSGGLGGWKPQNRVAILGTLRLTLNNKDKHFSPMGGDGIRSLPTYTRFNQGSGIRVRVVYGGISYVAWTGRILTLDSDDKNWGNRQTRVMAVDWMNVPANYPMKGTDIALNQTIDSAVTLLISRLSIQPEATDFDAGFFTFAQIFDNIKNNTKASSEFTKLANSELGYIYLKQDGTLIVEGATSRVGTRALDTVLSDPATLSYLLMEDGDHLLLEDGGRIVLDETTVAAAALDTDAESYNILLDNSVINSATIRAYPLIKDTAVHVVFTLGDPVFVPAGGYYDFYAHYVDASGAQMSAFNIVDTAPTTDYTANTKADGTGTDHSGAPDIEVHNDLTGFTDTAFVHIINKTIYGLYMTFLQIRGYGIHYGSGVEAQVDDTASQNSYGLVNFSMEQRYQKNVNLGARFGLAVIQEYKDPKSRITKLSYLANLNPNHMACFLQLSVGALIAVTEDRSGITNHYYITDRAFTIHQGGVINVEYGLKQNDSYLSGGLLPLTLDFIGKASGIDALNYGYLPIVSNLRRRSLSIWVYMDTDVPDTTYYGIICFGVNYELIVKQGRKLKLYDQQSGVDGAGNGTWTSTAAALSTGAWHHIVVTHDTSAWPTTSVPIIYVDGATVALTQDVAPSGNFGIEDGLEFVLGNAHSNNNEYLSAFDGKLFDARVYSRILSAAEVTAIYNSGAPLVTAGPQDLVFQGPAVYADQNTSIPGHAPADNLTENALRAVGIVHGAPLIRANP